MIFYLSAQLFGQMNKESTQGMTFQVDHLAGVTAIAISSIFSLVKDAFRIEVRIENPEIGLTDLKDKIDIFCSKRQARRCFCCHHSSRFLCICSIVVSMSIASKDFPFS